MKEQDIKMIQLFNEAGLEGVDIINELLRFRVLDQMVSSNANAREWGITPDRLFSLAQESTVQSFGEIPYDVSVFQKLYGPSFAIDLMDFIGETGYIEGMNPGHQWDIPLRKCIEEYKNEKDSVILFAYVEEYAGLVDEILQTFGKDRVVLYTASPVCYSVLSRLYPLAQITDTWPHASYFNHIVSASVGMFQNAEDIMEEVANGLNNLVKYGTAHLFLPLTGIQNQVGLNKMAIQFFLGQKNLEVVREWAPIGAYEFVLGIGEVKKMKAEICEITGESYRRTPFIALPHGVFSDLNVFSIVNYALSLCSVLLPGGQTDPAMGQDGLYSNDSRLPKRILDGLEDKDAYYLTVNRNGLDVTFGLEKIRPQEGAYWIFSDRELAYMWYAYFTCQEGATIVRRLAEMVLSIDALNQLLSSCRRRVLNVKEEATLVESLDRAKLNYEETIQQAQDDFQDRLEDIGKSIIPR